VTQVTRPVDRLLDTALDRSVLLGYSRIGSAARRRWWPSDPAPDALAGKRVLVTGATSGLGEAMARSFAGLGATVHLLGRNPDKVSASADRLWKQTGVQPVEEVCDVGDLPRVREWAADFTARVPALHGMVHNAGVMSGDREESPQGHELSLAVHVLGPHLSTELLQGPLVAGGGAVVWMSSGGMYGARLVADEDDVEFRRGTFNGVQAYARTKRMQVVLAEAWARRLAGSGVQVVSMHPGWSGTPGVSTHLPTFNRVLGPVLRTAEDAADTAVWLVATRPASHPPHFWHDRAQRPTTYGWQRAADPQTVGRLLRYVTRVTGTPGFGV
jgi:dehydrogenase/reductase SDR family member 12